MTQLQGREEIINMALDWLKEAPIMAFDEGSSRSDFMKRNYDSIRDSSIRTLMPNFAGKYWTVPRHPDPPDARWKYKYTLPTDLIRLSPIRQDGDKRLPRIDYELVGREILTDYDKNPLVIFGWRSVANEAEFNDAFVQMFAMNLALKAAHFITGKASYAEQLRAISRDMRDDVEATERKENPYGNPKQDINDMRALRAFSYGGRGSRRYG